MGDFITNLMPILESLFKIIRFNLRVCLEVKDGGGGRSEESNNRQLIKGDIYINI